MGLSAARPAKRRRRLRLVLIAAVLALALPLPLYAAAFFAAEPLLTVRTDLQPADAILVLGGDGPTRAFKATQIYHEGLAPRVLVSGMGDCDSIKESMAAANVPAEAISVECQSGTTWENAAFSAPLLREMGVKNAILVTSWYHTRRALGCLEANATGIHWMTAPADRWRPLKESLFGPEGLAVAKEYAKIVWYALIYGISFTGLEAEAGQAGMSSQVP